MASFGETLKRERELREISLREISDATKINIRYLEALETNRFDILPGGLFNKGFIRAYATFIGVDSETMVTCYLQEISAREGGATGLSGDVPPTVHRPAEAPRRRTPGAPAEAARPTRDGAIRGRPPSVPAAAPLAISGIERSAGPAAIAHGDQEPPAPAGPVSASRVLWGIVSLVAAAAVMLLILSFVMSRQQPGIERLATAGSSPEILPASPPDGAASDAPDSAQALGVDDDLNATGIPGGAPDEAPDGTAAPPPANIATIASPAATSHPRPATRPVATPQPAAPVTPLEAPRDQGTRTQDDADAAPGPMSLLVEARDRTWVQLTCDSREAINWVMRAGDTETMECLRIIRVSAADAAAVRLRVNDAPCLPLGEAGERVYGYTIRIDDFRMICPGSRRGRNG